MRLTKGIKKTLSVVLAAAMVIGGTATGGKISKAEEAAETVSIEKFTYNVTVSNAPDDAKIKFGFINNAGANGWTQGTTTEVSVENGTKDYDVAVTDGATEVKSLGWIDGTVGMKVKLNSFTINDKYTFIPSGNKEATITKKEDSEDHDNLALGDIWSGIDGYTNSDGHTLSLIKNDKGQNSNIVVTLAAGKEEPKKEDVTETPATSATGEAATGEAATVAPTPTEDPYADYKEEPNKEVDEGSMEGFQMYPHVDYDSTNFALKQKVVNVTPDADGKATAEIRFKATVDANDLSIFYIDSNLGNWGKISTNFKWAFKSVTVDGEEVEDVEDNQKLYGARDGDIEKGLRYNVRNPWNNYFLADKISFDTENVADLFGGAKFPIKKDSEYVFTFEFTGMTTGGNYVTYAESELPTVYDKDGVKIGELVTNSDGSTTIKPVEPAKPAETATGSATTGSSASGSSTSGSSATPAATTAAPEATATAAATTAPDDSANTTATLKVAKTKLVIAPGKSATVKVTSNTTFTASSSNKKVAKVKANKANVKISVPKSAKKGATANITVKAGKVKKVIKVTVANKVKKLKANKKKVTVKKGKTAKVVVKVTSQNKKAKTTDKLTVKTSNKKVAKIAKKSINKKKVVVKVKALKKGTSKITVKVGKKKVVVKVKVK